MRKQRAFLPPVLLFFLFICLSAHAQKEPHIIIQEADINVVCTSMDKFTCKTHRTVRILNEKGDRAANFAFPTDRTQKLTAFTATITNDDGKVLRKIKKSDLQRTQYNSDMVADGETFYYNYQPPTYPVSIVFDYEYVNTEGYVSFPVFCPLTSYDMELKQAKYTLQVPSDMEVRSKLLNMPENCIRTHTEGNKKTISIQLNDFASGQREQFAPSLYQTLPIAYLAPTQFRFLGTEGNMRSWEDFGKWQAGLIEGRDNLDPAFKAQLKQMTDTCHTEAEKVNVIYQLLGHSTRYNSIQLGIGGWQPAQASVVNRQGLGDCKGLSNYMRAMLKAIGIEGQYVLISTKHKRLFRDFPSLSQLDHAILRVPLPDDTLWLECTNPTLPIGYLHEDIAGHDAILITQQGGQLITLPQYQDKDNQYLTTIHVMLNENGSARIHYKAHMQGEHYETWKWAEKADNKTLKEQLQSIFHLPQAEFKTIEVKRDFEQHSHIPYIEVNFDVLCNNIASVTGQRLFVPLNVITVAPTKIKEYPERKNDISIENNIIAVDSTYIHLPEGFVIESCPQPFIADNNIIANNIQIDKDNNSVLIAEKTIIRKGRYDKSLYPSLTEQQSRLVNWKKQKIVLKK